jgi:hypothetical protein
MSALSPAFCLAKPLEEAILEGNPLGDTGPRQRWGTLKVTGGRVSMVLWFGGAIASMRFESSLTSRVRE